MSQFSVTAAGGLWLPVVVFWALLPRTLPAQQTEQRPPVIRTDVNTVLVDAVFRDKRGRALRDLKQDEVKISENGVVQQILSFRQVRSAGAARADLEPTVQGSQAGSIQVSRQIRLVTLVFERLGNQQRTLARQAALDFLLNDLGANVYYAVFYLDRTFRPLLSYTNEKDRIRRAIELATGSDASSLANDARTLTRAPRNRMEESFTDATVRGELPVQDKYFSISSAMEKYNERMDRDMFGRVSVFGLWGIVSELSRLPGRKSVLYFSEGLTLPGNLLPQYESLVNAANRALVSIHTIDARGLVVGSDQLLANRLLGDAVKGSIAARENDPVPQFFERVAADMIPEQFLAGDFALDSIHANGQMNLSDLAERTGGMAIYNTNDFRKPLRELSEEFNTYYEISYTPKDSALDGRFRSIQVKVSRPGASVQARNGYFALPSLPGETVFPYETPLLHALGREAMPRDVEFRADVVQFGEINGKRQAALVFDVPLKQVRFTPPTESTPQARSHLSVLSLVKDDTGRVVAKLSRDLAMNHPPEKVKGYENGRYIATRPIELEPGRYTLESVVADQEAGKFGTRRSVVVVPAVRPGPQLSEMVLVRRIDQRPYEPEPGDVFRIPDGYVVPTLSDDVTGGLDRMMSSFVVVYPETGATAELSLELQILRDGQVLNRVNPPLPQANAEGAYPFLMNIGLTGMAAAQYELRVTVRQGGKTARRSAFVNIVAAGSTR
jgi:VWFA-related protein